jgi:hypothetical protein
MRNAAIGARYLKENVVYFVASVYFVSGAG